MAIICAYCGQTLAKEDARFCSNCGATVSAEPIPTQSADESKKSPISKQDERGKPLLREQIAQQPPARSRTGSERSASLTSVSVAEIAVHNKDVPVVQVQEAIQIPLMPVLHEKLVQEREQEKAPGPLPTPPLLPATDGVVEYTLAGDLPETPLPPSSEQGVKEEAVEDHPTRPLVEAVEDRPTLLLKEVTPLPMSPSSASRGYSPLPASSLTLLKSTFPSQFRLVKDLRIAIAVFLCIVLVVGGIGTWIVVAQPFSVPAITQPQQSFQDASSGISLLYPAGWETQIDRAQSTIHFFDSSHTAQVNVSVVNSTVDSQTSDLVKYLQKQATQLGMTGGKIGTPFSFAGLSWQVIQGTVQQNGASYTAALFVALHGKRIVTFTQLAPQSVYNDEEKLIFVPMRASLHFS